jgi:hypothetical protein
VNFGRRLEALTASLERGDGGAFSNLFCEDGTYRDVFYGTFEGRAAIKHMLEERFWRDGEHFKWQMIDPVAQGDRGYSRFLFSFTSRRMESTGRRIVVEGMCFLQFSGNLIARYDEVVAPGIAFAQLGLPADEIARVLHDLADSLRDRPEVAPHLCR